MLSRFYRVPERFCKLTTSAGVNPAARRWPVFRDSRQQDGGLDTWPEEEERQTRKRGRDKVSPDQAVSIQRYQANCRLAKAIVILAGRLWRGWCKLHVPRRCHD